MPRCGLLSLLLLLLRSEGKPRLNLRPDGSFKMLILSDVRRLLLLTQQLSSRRNSFHFKHWTWQLHYGLDEEESSQTDRWILRHWVLTTFLNLILEETMMVKMILWYLSFVFDRNVESLVSLEKPDVVVVNGDALSNYEWTCTLYIFHSRNALDIVAVSYRGIAPLAIIQVFLLDSIIICDNTFLSRVQV